MKKKTNFLGSMFLVLSDPYSRELIKAAEMGFAGSESGLQLRRLHLTRKQYYTRLNQLITLRIVKKKRVEKYQPKRYVLTSFGQVVDRGMLRLANDLERNRWRLKQVDNLYDVPSGERVRIINSLISDSVIRQYFE